MMSETSAMPAVGRRAPAFSLPDAHGRKTSLAQFKGQWVVLYFYPKDDTSGCTVEAQGFQKTLKEFQKRGAVILGVSPDDAKSHCRFAEKYGLAFTLLSDVDHRMTEKYGVWVEKSMYGRKYMGVQRATLLIDPAGKVAHVWEKVKPAGHAEEVLAALDALQGA
jgi:peroxiredoxin Q/BCP